MRKNLKRAGAALIAAVMLMAALAACGGNGNSSAPKNNASNSSAAGTQSSSGGEASKAGTNSTGDGEIVTLHVYGFTNATANSDDLNAVAEAVSAITREKIGVEITLNRQYDGEKLNLALTSGEALDLVNFHSYSGGLEALVATGYAMPLDDLFAQYGQKILDVVPESYIDCSKVNGKLYMLPNLKDTARAAGFAMRKDVLDEIGVNPDDIKTWEDVHDVLVKVKEAKPDMYPLVPSWAGGGMQETIPYDNIGGDGIAVLENVFEDSTTVVNRYETAAYKEFCERMYQWNQEGLIMPDSTTTTESNLMSTVGFADYENIKPGKDLEIKKAWGVDCALIELTPPHTYTGMVAGSSFFIPTVSKHPEKAMQLWELMYTDPEISNIFVNGVEGKHWVYTDDSKTFLTYPEGLEAGTTGYESLDWAWPNARITPIWEGGDANQWTNLQEFCDSAAASPAMGFRFDNSKVMNEITACNNVVSKYNVGLRWGELNPDEALPQFISELKAAGADAIIAEKQSQLDAWLAANK